MKSATIFLGFLVLAALAFIVAFMPSEASAYAPSTQICFYRNIGSNAYLCPPSFTNPTTIQGGTVGTNAYAFEDQFGVNGGFNYTEFSNVSLILSELQYLNIHHFRGAGESVVAGNVNGIIQATNTLAAAGIKSTLTTNQSSTVSSIGSAISAMNPGAIEGIEGPNELDIASDSNWVADDQRVTQAIKTYVNANPGYFIIGPSLGGFGSYGQLGDLSAYIDYGNTHDYGASFYPETPGYGGPDYGGFLYGGIDDNLANARQASVSKPIMATEFGQWTGTGTNRTEDGAAAEYNLRQVFAHQSKGVPRSYIYNLIDDGGQQFGVLFAANNSKFEFREIGEFMNILKDTTPLSSPCTVPATVPTGGVSSLGICMSNGQYALIVWQPVTSWDTNAHAYVADTPIQTSLQYSPGFGPSTVTRWSYPRYGYYSNSGLMASGSTPPTPFPVTGRPTVVMFNGPASPTPLPTLPAGIGVPTSPTASP